MNLLVGFDLNLNAKMKKITAIQEAILQWLTTAIVHKDIECAVQQYIIVARQIAEQLGVTPEDVLAVWACYFCINQKSLRAMKTLPSQNCSG